MRIGIGRLVALVFQVVDVAQDGLENQEDYNRDAKHGMESAELKGEGQSTCSQAALRCGKFGEIETYISRSLVCNIHP